MQNRSVSSNIFVYLVAFYLFNWYFQLGSRISFFNEIRLEFLMALLLLGVSAFNLNFQERTPLFSIVLSWLLLLAIYTIFSVDFESSSKVYIDRVLKFSVVALFITVFAKDETGIRVMMLGLLLAFAKLTSEGFIGWLGGGLMWQNQGVMRLHGAITMFRHPNSFSGLAVGAVAILLPMLSSYRSLIVRACIVVTLIFSTFVIIFTASRTGYVAIIGVLAFYFRAEIKRRFWLFLTSLPIVVLGAIYIIPDQYLGRFYSIFTLEEAEGGSALARIQILIDAWEVFLKFPFGVGVSAFPYIRGELFGRYQDTHNLYLEILTNLGIFGFILFFVLVSVIFRMNYKIYECPTASAYQKALAHSMLLFLVARLLLGLFGMDLYEVYWWLIIGFTAANYRLLRQMRLKDESRF